MKIIKTYVIKVKHFFVSSFVFDVFLVGFAGVLRMSFYRITRQHRKVENSGFVQMNVALL